MKINQTKMYQRSYRDLNPQITFPDISTIVEKFDEDVVIEIGMVLVIAAILTMFSAILLNSF